MSTGSKRIQQEFFLQGDIERRMDQFPISPLCDRNAVSQSKSQMGFIEFVVRPLLQTFLRVVCGEGLQREINDNIGQNFDHWKKLEEAEKARVVAAQQDAQQVTTS